MKLRVLISPSINFEMSLGQPALLLFVIGICFSYIVRADDSCLDWFKSSKISPASKDCTIQCDILPKDMGTFNCADWCDEFCKSQKCVPSQYWKKKIQNGRPSKWDLPSETVSAWTEAEKNKLMELLDRLPDQLRAIPFEGFFRMKKSIDMTNPATTASSGKSIVIYDRAFDNPFLSTSRVLVHELGHVIYLGLSEAERRSYQNMMGWKSVRDSDETRSGDFVSSRAKDSIDEDFAENLNFLLFEPDVLRAKVPLAFKWLSKKFPGSFKLKEDCQHEKK